MKTIVPFLAFALLLLAPSRSFALMEIDQVTPERAKELGFQIKVNAAGPEAIRVVLEFKKEGKMKSFKRVDLELHEAGRLLAASSLEQEQTTPDRVVVGFAADRASLDKFTVRVVTEGGPRERTGYDLRLKDFVQLDKVR